MSDSSHIHAVDANPDASSFHDRDRNELRAIVTRASNAIDALIDVGSSIRELHVIAESSDENDGRLHSVDALVSTFSALDDIRTIVRLARSVLADHEVSP